MMQQKTSFVQFLYQMTKQTLNHQLLALQLVMLHVKDLFPQILRVWLCRCQGLRGNPRHAAIAKRPDTVIRSGRVFLLVLSEKLIDEQYVFMDMLFVD